MNAIVPITASADAPAVSTFDFNGMDLRVVDLDGDPWFVAADAGRVLDLSNVTMALKVLETSEIFKLNRIELGEKRGGRPMPIISESGLYKLIMRSDKPQAKAFQDWVTRDVLPTMRKTGAYVKGEEKVATGEMSDTDMAVMDAIQAGVEYHKIKVHRMQIGMQRGKLMNMKKLDEAGSILNSFWNAPTGERILYLKQRGVRSQNN